MMEEEFDDCEGYFVAHRTPGKVDVKLCLDRIVPRLSDGAYVVLDDYNDYGGCRRAVDGFLESGPDVDVIARAPNFVFRRRGRE